MNLYCNYYSFLRSDGSGQYAGYEDSDFLENFVMNAGLDSLNITNTENQINALLQTTLQQSNNYKKVLSEKGKKQIQEEMYQSTKYPEQKCCPISQKNFAENSLIIKLPCKHIFDPDMILKWLEKENASCPICRYKLDSKEEDKSFDYILKMNLYKLTTEEIEKLTKQRDDKQLELNILENKTIELIWREELDVISGIYSKELKKYDESPKKKGKGKKNKFKFIKKGKF